MEKGGNVHPLRVNLKNKSKKTRVRVRISPQVNTEIPLPDFDRLQNKINALAAALDAQANDFTDVAKSVAFDMIALRAYCHRDTHTLSGVRVGEAAYECYRCLNTGVNTFTSESCSACESLEDENDEVCLGGIECKCPAPVHKRM